MDSGSFYIIATPIGNLEDITYRAVQILRGLDLILCEDVSHSSRLLRHYEINVQTKKFFFQRTDENMEWVHRLIESGKNIGYISDAGTPGISDPGSALVRYLRQKKHRIIPIPGPSAFASLLSVSGFQVNPTIFLGFLSDRKGRKKRELEEYKEKECLIVFYESVHKLKETLEIVQEIYTNCPIIIGRELTKEFEEILYFSESKLISLDILKLKGEFTILINNRTKHVIQENTSN